MGLLDAKRIAIVGVAKNSGKTTTLNALLKVWHEAHLRGDYPEVGLCSVGIDGETADYLIGTPKPPVRVMPGIWVITVQSAVDDSQAHVEFVESLGIETPLGELLIVRVLEPGDMVLAGVRHREDLREVISRLQTHGIERIFIDGAYGRVAAAHGTLSDGVIVSTGAILSPRPDQIIEKTRAMITRLSLPKVVEDWQHALLERAEREDRALLGGPTIPPVPLPARSALVGLPKAQALWTRETTAIAIPGLVSDRVLEMLGRVGGPRTLLIPDGTALQADATRLARFQKTWEIKVLHRQHVLGISVNPTSIGGWTVPENPLIASMRAIWPEITIFNPFHGIDSGQL